MSTFIENTQDKGCVEHDAIERILNIQKKLRQFTSSPEGKMGVAFVALGTIALIATSFFLPPIGAIILLGIVKVVLATLVLFLLALLSTNDDEAGKKLEKNYFQMIEDSFHTGMEDIQETTPLGLTEVEK